MQNNVIEILLNTANKFPDKNAIIHKDDKISYAQLNDEVKQFAAYLQNKGVKKEDRVLIFVPISINLYRTIMAVNYIGATAVVLDEWVSLKRMELCCQIAKCHAIITIPKAKILYLFSSYLRRIPLKLSTNYSKKTESLETPVKTNDEDTSLITFTTGSTGIPKAAKRTFGFLYEQLKALQIELNPTENNITLLTLPIFTFMNMALGATTIVESINQKNPDKYDFNKLYKSLDTNKVNSIICSPSYILTFAKYCLAHNISLLHLKSIFTGGAPIFPEDARILQNAFPNCNTLLLYGSTEAEPISSISAKDLSSENILVDNGLNVGKVYVGIRVKIIKYIDAPIILEENGTLNSYELPVGITGEIIVSGDHVLKEYFNAELFERNKIIEHGTIWHRTADAGFFNKNGNLFLCGRAKILITKNEKQFSPFVLESVLKSIAGVNIGTILQQNNNIIAVLEVSRAADKKSVLEKVKALKYSFDAVKFIKRIPRDSRHYSKIDYEALRKQC